MLPCCASGECRKPTRYQVNQNLTTDEVRTLTGGPVRAGWYTAANGQYVYICDGCHKDGYFGFKVLQLDGLR